MAQSWSASARGESPEILEISSSPSDSGDLAILDVSPAPVRSTFVINQQDLDNLEDVSEEEDVQVTSSRPVYPPPTSASSYSSHQPSDITSVDDVEITSVEYHPDQTPARLVLPIHSDIVTEFLFPSNSNSEPSSRNSTPPVSRRTVFHLPRPPTTIRHGSRRTRHATHVPFSNRSAALYHALFGMTFSGLAPRLNRFASEQSQLEQTLLLSAEQYTFAPNSAPQDVKTLPIPTETRPGYTRSIDSSKTYLCAWCEVELNQGIPEKPDQDTASLHSWNERFGLTSEADHQLSKRVFFSTCGHVYCGWCVKRIINRPKGKRAKKSSKVIKDPTVDRAIASCCVSGCKKPFRGKFIELFC